ncbi:unnamed protein product [Chondrus crispus]|uniref:NAD(P)-binding domain-containing protein n=1 Tax=Chondrus crispus TaxID=2769 RepID=R7QI49_CHOCR|nr:unnamed protein product [Chondrus crispus]CDF37085.1 unnamed protein product [Chondrus crispus]|eukprot:XP_005716904.1 unnamed protein product [Chondrus crispus]
MMAEAVRSGEGKHLGGWRRTIVGKEVVLFFRYTAMYEFNQSRPASSPRPDTKLLTFRLLLILHPLLSTIPMVMALPLCFLSALPLHRQTSSCSFSPETRHVSPSYRPSTARHTRNVRRAPVMTNTDDLLIIGAGTLGRLIATVWREAHPAATILGETRSATSHVAVALAGATPSLAGSSTEKFPYVVFCAPPGQSEDYPAAAAIAASRISSGGRLVFTSSGSVHGRSATRITEETPELREGRSLVLAEAEDKVLAVPEGNVIRLAGLYTRDRGPHVFWLRKRAVPGPVDSFVNMLHYEDAATAVVAVLRMKEEKREGRSKFLACAERSVTRREICEAALKHPKYKETGVPEYGEGEAGEPRLYDGSWTRRVTGWKPKYEAFDDFMEIDAESSSLGRSHVNGKTSQKIQQYPVSRG